MEFYDQVINMIKCMYSSTDELCWDTVSRIQLPEQVSSAVWRAVQFPNHKTRVQNYAKGLTRDEYPSGLANRS